MRDYRFSSFNVSRSHEHPAALKMKNDALRQSIRPRLFSFPIMTDDLSLFVLKTDIRKSLLSDNGENKCVASKNLIYEISSIAN